MLRHEELRNDPLGVARRVWDDTAWRAAIITAALIFLLELVIWAVAVEPGVGWVASIVTLLAIGRALTMRPLRGELNDPENLSLLLGLVALLSAESLFWFTSIGDTFAEHAIYWPFSLVLMGIVLAARALAPYAMRPLVAWALLFAILFFTTEMVGWAANASVPAPSFSWGVIATVLALIARWVVGRGFSGHIASPLNVALALFIVLTWWLEYGAEASGVGAASWGVQELYWPWIVFTTGIAAGCAIVAPPIAKCLNRNRDDAT